jgi:hypothetical protein
MVDGDDDDDNKIEEISFLMMMTKIAQIPKWQVTK